MIYFIQESFQELSFLIVLENKFFGLYLTQAEVDHCNGVVI